MEATATERENTAELNQERAIKGAKEEPGASAESTTNIGEMLIFLGLALFLDAAGALSDLSIFLAIPIRIITLLPTLAFLLWRLLKGGKRVYLVGLSIMGMSEAVLSALPAYTIFVLYVWYRDSRLGKSTIGKISKFTKVIK